MALLVPLFAVLVAWSAAVAYAADWFLRRRYGLAPPTVDRAVGRGALWAFLLGMFRSCIADAVVPALHTPGYSQWVVALIGLSLTHLTAAGVMFSSFDVLRREAAVPTRAVAAVSAVAGAVWVAGPVGLLAALRLAR